MIDIDTNRHIDSSICTSKFSFSWVKFCQLFLEETPKFTFPRKARCFVPGSFMCYLGLAARVC